MVELTVQITDNTNTIHFPAEKLRWNHRGDANMLEGIPGDDADAVFGNDMNYRGIPLGKPRDSISVSGTVRDLSSAQRGGAGAVTAEDLLEDLMQFSYNCTNNATSGTDPGATGPFRLKIPDLNGTIGTQGVEGYMTAFDFEMYPGEESQWPFSFAWIVGTTT